MRTRPWTRRRVLGALGLGVSSLGWPRARVWSAPAGLPAESLRIVYYTDIHARLEWDTPQALEQAAGHINAQGTDLILCGGDCVADGFQSGRALILPRWEAYLERLHRRLRVPPHTVLGNHDLLGAMPEDGSPPEPDPRALFRQLFGLTRIHRSFDVAGYHFILLDSVRVTGDALKYQGLIDADQMAWLRADLERVDPTTPIVLMSHMPLLTAFYQATEGAQAMGPANRVLVNNREVLAAFANHRLLLVLQGHLHVNELLRWRDTTFITGGALCGKWWRGHWHGTDAGYGVLTLRRDRVEWQYLDYGWQPRRPARDTPPPA